MSTIDKKVIQAKKLIHCLNNASSKELMKLYPDLDELLSTIDCMINEGSLNPTMIDSLKEVRKKVNLSFHSSEPGMGSLETTQSLDPIVDTLTKQPNKKGLNPKPVSDTASATKIQQLLQDQKV